MTNEQLVSDWMDGMTSEAIAKKYGRDHNAVRQRILWLRSKGVNLPRRRDRQRCDVAALNAIVEAKGSK